MRKLCFILLVITLTVLTMTISGIAFAHPSKGSDCSRCHNSTPTPPAPSNTTPQKATGSSCTKTSEDTLKSCKSGVQDDYWLGIAKCDNLPSSESKTCKQQAKTDMKAGNEECKAQFDARKEICKDLGQGIYNPVINPSDFVNNIDNPLFPLTPGTTFIYEGMTEKGNEHVEVKVTHNTKVILGVTCIEVRDTVTVNGILAEDTLDWYAQDKDGNVWYFGENSLGYDGNGEIVSLEGSWKAGVDGAKPGIIMEAHPQVGDVYRQEFALGVAEDMAEILSLNESVLVNSVTYNNCLKTKEFSPLEPDVLENKFYAPGVGNIRTVDTVSGEFLDLVQIKTE
ncbi:MAG: hypothetical protein MUO31_14240 [Thermodesulfovibrionales bacterium]|nr:hypothetical protein [Thermodesulfovibrionales bacterium]